MAPARFQTFIYGVTAAVVLYMVSQLPSNYTAAVAATRKPLSACEGGSAVVELRLSASLRLLGRV